MTEPAFLPVATRPPPTTRAPQFSSAVVDYVQRAFYYFNNVKNTPAFAGITDTDIRAKLATIVNEALRDGDVDSRNWSAYKLPHEFIAEERNQAALHFAQTAAFTTNHNLSSETPTTGPIYPSPNTRKRNSSDLEMDANGPIPRPVSPPWKKRATKAVKASLTERITGPSKDQAKKGKNTNKLASNRVDTSQDALERRKQRFGHISPVESPFTSSRDDSPMGGADSGPIVGTCQTLEKNYYRLTAPPNPSTVRPLHVLEKALNLIIDKWKSAKDYAYICDQLKSMRQDLTVQHVKSAFTIKVYEIHARIALQMKDLGEYNQCQTQLRALYRLGLGGKESHADEFLAYRILYLMYTCNRTDMNDMLADLTPADKETPFVRVALQVRSAVASGNYYKFFRLYSEVQNMNMVPYLMDMFVERERLAAMAKICRTCVEWHLPEH